jgi:hypothetical protein
MKRLLFLVITVLLSCQIAFSQEVQGVDHINGGRFEKKIEYNASSGITKIDEKTGVESPYYEVKNKTPLEKLFFGLTNSPVEYVIETSFEGSAGLRLYKKRPDGRNWILEIIPFGDYELAARAVKRETEEIEIPLWFLGRLPQNYQEQVRENNAKVSSAAGKEETYKQCRPKTKIFTLNHIGDRLREEITALIVGFRAEGGTALIVDGYTVTFRCVIGDELWTLTIHMPQRRARQMSDLCRQMIEDAQLGEFDESKYAQILQVPTDD